MTRDTRARSCLFHPAARPLSALRFMGSLLIGCMLLLPSASWAANPSPRELLDGGRVDEAIRLLVPLATGDNAAAFNYLGRAYFALGDWDKAVRHCERATQLDPGNAEFQLWLGRSYGEKANSAAALTAFSLARKTVAAFEAAHARDRNSLAIARDLAEFYSSAPSIVGGGGDKALALAGERGQHETAEREYNESIRSDHNSAASYLEFARYLKGRNIPDRFQRAVDDAVKSTRIRPIDRYEAAELSLRAGYDLPKATQQMRAYIQSGHTVEEAPLFRAHFLLGEILLKSGDANQAAAEYQASLALASSYRPAADALRRLAKR